MLCCPTRVSSCASCKACFELPMKLSSTMKTSLRQPSSRSVSSSAISCADVFDAGLAPVDRDDVAELALERAAARELHRHRRVLVPAQQIEARNRAARHVRLVGNAVDGARGALFESRGDTGEDFFGFADQHVIGFELQRFGLAAGPRAADEGPRVRARWRAPACAARRPAARASR